MATVVGFLVGAALVIWLVYELIRFLVHNLATLLAWGTTSVLVGLLFWVPWAALQLVRERNGHLRSTAWPTLYTQRDLRFWAAVAGGVIGLLFWPVLAETRGAWGQLATPAQWGSAVLPLLPPVAYAFCRSSIPSAEPTPVGRASGGPFLPEGPAQGRTPWLGSAAGAVERVGRIPSGTPALLGQPGVWGREPLRTGLVESRPDGHVLRMRLVNVDPRSGAWNMSPFRADGGL
ncbi:hypothetical protein ACWC24_24400 [Streptomyces sp. NPDC001443]